MSTLTQLSDAELDAVTGGWGGKSTSNSFNNNFNGNGSFIASKAVAVSNNESFLGGNAQSSASSSISF